MTNFGCFAISEIVSISFARLLLSLYTVRNHEVLEISSNVIPHA